MEFENIFTPNSSKSAKHFEFSPLFSCGVNSNTKQSMESLFDIVANKGQDMNEDGLLSNINLLSSTSPFLDFPSPVSIGVFKNVMNNNFELLQEQLDLKQMEELKQQQQQLSFKKIVPMMELPLNIVNKFEKKIEIKKNNNNKIIKQNKLEKKKVEKKTEKKTINIESKPVVKITLVEEKVEEKKGEEKKEGEEGFRGWTVIEKSQEDFYTQITCKTRCDKPSEEVDYTLYSSLKYEIKSNLFGSFNYKFLLAKIYVVDALTGEVITKNNNPVLKGTIQCTIVNSSESNTSKVQEVSGTLKVQFTDISYHHKKGEVCWEIQYFQPDDLNNSILKMRSSPFIVYARKPSTEVKKRKKKSRRRKGCGFI